MTYTTLFWNKILRLFFHFRNNFYLYNREREDKFSLAVKYIRRPQRPFLHSTEQIKGAEELIEIIECLDAVVSMDVPHNKAYPNMPIL